MGILDKLRDLAETRERQGTSRAQLALAGVRGDLDCIGAIAQIIHAVTPKRGPRTTSPKEAAARTQSGCE